MNKETIVINKIIHDSVESNLVYPTEKGYKLICKIDKEWIESQLRMKFDSNVHYINNKYAVKINDRLYYQHDKSIWLIEFTGHKRD